MDHEFCGEVIEWRGPAPYYFVGVPEEECVALRVSASGAGYGWGMVPIRVWIGRSEWKTSLWPRDGGYLVPLKDAVRKPEGLDAGDAVDVRLRFEALPRKQKSPAKRVAVARPRGSREPVSAGQLAIVPANEAAWEDLQAVFGPAGDTARCWCQRFRMLPKESWASEGPEELAARLREQTACGN